MRWRVHAAATGRLDEPAVCVRRYRPGSAESWALHCEVWYCEGLTARGGKEYRYRLPTGSMSQFIEDDPLSLTEAAGQSRYQKLARSHAEASLGAAADALAEVIALKFPPSSRAVNQRLLRLELERCFRESVRDLAERTTPDRTGKS